MRKEGFNRVACILGGLPYTRSDIGAKENFENVLEKVVEYYRCIEDNPFSKEGRL